MFLSIFFSTFRPFIFSTGGLAALQSALLFKQEAEEGAPWPSEAEREEQKKQEQHL